MAHTLHIFNPDTDYALSCKSPIYTPPAIVAAFRDEYALLPAIFASRGDTILIFNESDKPFRRFQDLAEEKDIRIVKITDLGSNAHINNISEIRPWGWNHTLTRQLKDKSDGKLSGLLPSSEKINRLARLSHRNTSDRFHEYFKYCGFNECETPRECMTLGEAMEFMKLHPDCFFKAPHSSSGRGVMHTEGLTDLQISQWISGIISTQGSVMAEADMKKSLDFASEWKCSDGKACFLGWAVFDASRRGKYHYNIIAPQHRLRQLIEMHSTQNLESIIELQKSAIEKIVDTDYEGFLGIDMVASKDGRVNPCIEINFRITMGLVALDINNILSETDSMEANILRKYFPSDKLTL